MFNNVNETLIEGSNTVHLSIPQEDYFFSYNSLNFDSAKDLVENYFQLRSREGIPNVKNIELITASNTVRITVDVDYSKVGDRNLYEVPDLISNQNISTKIQYE